MNKILLKEDLYLRIAFAPVKENVISNIRDESYERISFVLDLSCEKFGIILKEVKAYLTSYLHLFCLDNMLDILI